MPTPQEPERGREHLLLQVLPWPGARMDRECLRPPPPGQDTVSYGYLGDMQLRFVFDQPRIALPAAVRPDDLARLELTPQQAVKLGVANTLAANGAPQVTPLAGGVYTLRGPHLEYNATYLLDRAFWRRQLEKFPQGLLAALPRKGVLLFAPAGEPAVEGELARQAARILASAHTAHVSACIYRFDAAGWHPHADLPAPPSVVREVSEDDEDAQALEPGTSTVEPERDLDRVAIGQRMLVFSVLGGFVVNAVERAGGAPPALVLGLALALTFYSLLGVVRLGSGLGRSTGATITLMVLTCVPLVNLATWIALSFQATRVLRAAGWKVGLLGARS